MSVENALPIRQKFFSHVDFVTCCHHPCKLLIQKRKHLYRCCYSRTLILATMFQLCINESLFISLVILQKPQCENIRKSNILRCGGGFYCHFVISQEMWKLKRLFPSWSALPWSFWQPSCRLGCKHFRVVVHGLLQGAAHFGVLLPSIVCWTNLQTFLSRWV